MVWTPGGRPTGTSEGGGRVIEPVTPPTTISETGTYTDPKTGQPISREQAISRGIISAPGATGETLKSIGASVPGATTKAEQRGAIEEAFRRGEITKAESIELLKKSLEGKPLTYTREQPTPQDKAQVSKEALQSFLIKAGLARPELAITPVDTTKYTSEADIRYAKVAGKTTLFVRGDLIRRTTPFTDFSSYVESKDVEVSNILKYRTPIGTISSTIDKRVRESFAGASPTNPFALKNIARQVYEVESGITGGIIEKPVTTAANLATMALVTKGATIAVEKMPFLTKSIFPTAKATKEEVTIPLYRKMFGAPKGVSMTDPLVKLPSAPEIGIGRGIAAIKARITPINIVGGAMVTTYGADVATRISAAENKPREAGKILGTEILPMAVGAKIGSMDFKVNEFIKSEEASFGGRIKYRPSEEIIRRVERQKPLTEIEYERITTPVFQKMGVSVKDIEKYYLSTKAMGEYGLEEYTGMAFSRAVHPELPKSEAFIGIKETPETVIRTIGHEVGHLTQPKGLSGLYGVKQAEKTAYAFEERFIGAFKETYPKSTIITESDIPTIKSTDIGEGRAKTTKRAVTQIQQMERPKAAEEKKVNEIIDMTTLDKASMGVSTKEAYAPSLYEQTQRYRGAIKEKPLTDIQKLTVSNVERITGKQYKDVRGVELMRSLEARPVIKTTQPESLYGTFESTYSKSLKKPVSLTKTQEATISAVERITGKSYKDVSGIELMKATKAIQEPTPKLAFISALKPLQTSKQEQKARQKTALQSVQSPISIVKIKQTAQTVQTSKQIQRDIQTPISISTQTPKITAPKISAYMPAISLKIETIKEPDISTKIETRTTTKEPKTREEPFKIPKEPIIKVPTISVPGVTPTTKKRKKKRKGKASVYIQPFITIKNI